MNAVQLISSLVVPKLGRDMSYARLGSDGLFEIGRPSPWRQNLREDIAIFRRRSVDGDDEAVVLFRTSSGEPAQLEVWEPESSVLDWRVVRPIEGNGAEQSHVSAMRDTLYFRIRQQ